MLNRRDLLRQAALSALVSGTGLGSGINQLASPSGSARAINALQLEPFVDPLPLLQLLPLQDRRITMREMIRGFVPVLRANADGLGRAL